MAAKLIVGLGNPGGQYAKTRHNVGFMCIEQVLIALGLDKEKPKEKWQSSVVETSLYGQKIFFIRPLTFMNNSGEAVRTALSFSKGSAIDDLLVIYDDMDLKAGQIRLRMSGGSGGHNGVKSIIQHTHTEDFKRIRLGIGRPPRDFAVVDYVLSAFSKSEAPIVQEAVLKGAQAVLATCKDPFESVMNTFNLRA